MLIIRNRSRSVKILSVSKVTHRLIRQDIRANDKLRYENNKLIRSLRLNHNLSYSTHAVKVLKSLSKKNHIVTQFNVILLIELVFFFLGLKSLILIKKSSENARSLLTVIYNRFFRSKGYEYLLLLYNLINKACLN